MADAHPSEDLVDAPAKNLGEELAYPCLPPVDPNGGGSAGGYPYPEMGMRKRELFAAMAMQGLFGSEVFKDLTPTEHAKEAVLIADALLKELAK